MSWHEVELDGERNIAAAIAKNGAGEQVVAVAIGRPTKDGDPMQCTKIEDGKHLLGFSLANDAAEALVLVLIEALNGRGREWSASKWEEIK